MYNLELTPDLDANGNFTIDGKVEIPSYSIQNAEEKIRLHSKQIKIHEDDVAVYPSGDDQNPLKITGKQTFLTYHVQVKFQSIY